MIVVSSTSPIVNLAVIGQLDLLRQLYGKVILPQSVYDEIAIAGEGQPGAVEVSSFEWIEIGHVTDQLLLASLRLELDEGEAEAIILALETRADLLLLDERKGRAIAARLGLQFVGLLGVLLEAKQAGLIPAVKPLVDDLIAKAGFWIGQELYEHLLRVAGE
jgi:predicted nucleic acid-binding protein